MTATPKAWRARGRWWQVLALLAAGADAPGLLAQPSTPPGTVLVPGAVFEAPAGAPGKGFGRAVAGLGADSLGTGATLIVGAPLADLAGLAAAGRAFLFADPTDADPVVLQSPAPSAAGRFGAAVAAAGDDVVVGAPGERAGSFDGAGVVYRFEADGNPLATIQSPAPVSGGGFGAAVAGASGLVLVGAPAPGRADAPGAAYLIPDPPAAPRPLERSTPALGALFGTAVALSGADAFVGAPFEGGGGQEVGAVYQFEADPARATFGQPVRTFANPRAATTGAGIQDGFGAALAAAGGLLVVGAPFADAGAAGAGEVHVFDADRGSATFGQLLTTIANPSPTVDAAFGAAVAIVGRRILVGAPFDDADGQDAGALYAFDDAGMPLDPPRLRPRAPTSLARFGSSIASLGTDGDAVVGAPGPDELFQTSGTAVVLASCGNGVVSGGEQCDPPGEPSCSPFCTDLPPVCGAQALRGAIPLQAQSTGPVFCNCGDTAGDACDDGIACTENDACTGSGGACGGTPNDALCDDGNLCTDDRCDPAVGCLHQPRLCVDDDPCTANACNPSTGECTLAALGCECSQDGECDDRNFCSGVERCVRCKGCEIVATARPCCARPRTCAIELQVAAGERCDDADACTADDRCDGGGRCAGQPSAGLAAVTCAFQPLGWPPPPCQADGVTAIRRRFDRAGDLADRASAETVRKKQRKLLRKHLKVLGGTRSMVRKKAFVRRNGRECRAALLDRIRLFRARALEVLGSS